MGTDSVTNLLLEIDKSISLEGILGYLNFSEGRPDVRFQQQLNTAFGVLEESGHAQPWELLREVSLEKLGQLVNEGKSAFQNCEQARALIEFSFGAVLSAYQDHHKDLLSHVRAEELFRPFFLARVCETVLEQGPPWSEEGRILSGTIQQLNDYVGYRPIALLETRDDGEPYDRERFRPIPLYIQEAGSAFGPFQTLVRRCINVIESTDSDILHDADFDIKALDELAADIRAYDHTHPASRRPNHGFGEWDPHHINSKGRFDRYVVRIEVLDALLRWINLSDDMDQGQKNIEAAIVLGATVLMGAGITGGGPTYHDSSVTFSTLVPQIARYRDAFYSFWLQQLTGSHGERLRENAETARMPFAAARQYLNREVSHQRAIQLRNSRVALLFAHLGHPAAARQTASTVPALSFRFQSEIFSHLTACGLHIEQNQLNEAAGELEPIRGLIDRGIRTGAIVDPWNILGFQGQFPLHQAREDSVADPRVHDLARMMELTFMTHARLATEAAARGNDGLAESTLKKMSELAEWWDQFGSYEVTGVRRVVGEESVTSARHVARTMQRRRAAGEAAGDLAFWKRNIDEFDSPKAFAIVVDALLRNEDYPAALGLLMQWLSQAWDIPLENEHHSFFELSIRWLVGVTSGSNPGRKSKGGSDPDRRPDVRRFFELMEVNAQDYWAVPHLNVLQPGSGKKSTYGNDEDNPFGAAYEGMTFQDSADDGFEGGILDDGPQFAESPLDHDAGRLILRLRFIATLARMWAIAAYYGRNSHKSDRAEAGSGVSGPQPTKEEIAWKESLQGWAEKARLNLIDLANLQSAIHELPLPEPSGTHDSMVEYDRRRVQKEQFLQSTVATSLEIQMACRVLAAGLYGVDGSRPTDEQSAALELDLAIWAGDHRRVAAILPEWVAEFRTEPLVFIPLEEGGRAEAILQARIAQAVIASLLERLPRLGLFRETFHLLKLARQMEQNFPGKGRRVSEYERLFEVACRAVVQTLIETGRKEKNEWVVATAQKQGPTSPSEFVAVLEDFTKPFLAEWGEHSRTLRLSPLDAVKNDEQWKDIRQFIERYGRELFHPKFMALGNLRGIVHGGVNKFLNRLVEEADPLGPARLVEDLEHGLSIGRTTRSLEIILQTIISNYEEYRDYNSTTTQSDYGDRLYVLMEFLRTKARYDRHDWQFRPLSLMHEMLARNGQHEIAALWEQRLINFTGKIAEAHLKELRELQELHQVQLQTVAERIQGRFSKRLKLNYLVARVRPVLEEAREGDDAGGYPAFEKFQSELDSWEDAPLGVGFDPPAWIQTLESEAEQVRSVQRVAVPNAFSYGAVPARALTFDELRKNFRNWEDSPLMD